MTGITDCDFPRAGFYPLPPSLVMTLGADSELPLAFYCVGHVDNLQQTGTIFFTLLLLMFVASTTITDILYSQTVLCSLVLFVSQ